LVANKSRFDSRPVIVREQINFVLLHGGHYRYQLSSIVKDVSIG
jgi:hypothetical protein